MQTFKVGMAKLDITPPLGTLLCGYPTVRPAQKILDNLNVYAVVLETDHDTVAFISAEICVLGSDSCALIASTVAKETGIKEENIFISTTHTHSGPATVSTAGWGDANSDYLNETLIPCSVKVATMAFANRQSAMMAVGRTESYAGINRREISDSGEVILGQTSEGLYDPKMTALVFKTVSGENIGTLIHFACHPTAAGANLSITRDWPGLMVDHVEDVTGAPCMYINGAEGDIGPRLSNGMTTGDDSHVIEIGRIAAIDAEKAVNNATEFKIPELKVLTETISLPTVPMPSLESVIAEMEAMGDPEKLIEVDILKYDRLKTMKKMYETEIEKNESLQLRQTVIALDNLTIVSLPFETFCEISLAIQRESVYEQTLIFGLTGGSCGYFPTEEQLPYGGYEVDSFRATTIPGFIDGLDKHVVGEFANLLNKLSQQDN